jgi:hypothetical protein
VKSFGIVQWLVVSALVGISACNSKEEVVFTMLSNNGGLMDGGAAGASVKILDSGTPPKDGAIPPFYPQVFDINTIFNAINELCSMSISEVRAPAKAFVCEVPLIEIGSPLTDWFRSTEVRSKDACGQGEWDWYRDQTTAPPKVVFCDSACNLRIQELVNFCFEFAKRRINDE